MTIVQLLSLILDVGQMLSYLTLTYFHAFTQ